LRYFLAVAETLHFGRAANNLGIAQPPLSQQIRKLEQALGIELFERDRRGVRLSERGRRFLPEARAAVERVDAVYSAARAESGTHVGRLEIGIIGTATYGTALDAVATYRTAYPQVEVNVHVWINTEQREGLRTRTLDAGFLRPFSGDHRLERFEVERNGLVVVLPATHPLRDSAYIDPACLASEPFVLFPRARAAELHDMIVGICNTAGFSPQVVAVGDEINVMIALVAAGMGVSIVPDVMRHTGRPRVCYRPLRTPTRMEIPLVLAYRREDQRPLLHTFVSHVRKHAQSKTVEHEATKIRPRHSS
jgi:DNA-binding transcriptional LysR family regulator